MKQIESWVKRQNKDEGIQNSIQAMHETEVADEIFKVWDKQLRRYVTYAEFAENLIALGLAPDH